MLCLTDFQNENLNVRLLKPGKIMGGKNISLLSSWEIFEYHKYMKWDQTSLVLLYIMTYFR